MFEYEIAHMFVQVVIELSRSCNRVDKPYLMLQTCKLCWDTALMEYGPAVQASLGSLHLVDKLHTAISGQYLELVSTNPGGDLLSLLYRKVINNIIISDYLLTTL